MTRDRILLLAIAATWLVGGFIEPFTPSFGQPYNEATLPHAVVLSVLLFAWCKSHAATLGVVPPMGAPLLVGLIAPVGIPYYFFLAFSWRRALLAMGKTLLFAVFCVLLSAGGQFLALQVAT